MLYKFTGIGYIVGLPARDLNDEELDDTQKQLLADAVKGGVYLAPIPPAKVAKLASQDDIEENK